MNQNLSEIIFVLDRSGSMAHLTEDTIGGFNSLIEKEKNSAEGVARVTMVLFDHEITTVYDSIDIQKVPLLTEKTYFARGCTALLDAVGSTIDRVGARLAATPEEDRPARILFVITTDGYENSSRDYTAKQVKDMITRQQEVYNWHFLFLGAGIDAVSTADSIGIRASNACAPSRTCRGTQTSYEAVGQVFGSMRKCRSKKLSAEDFDACCVPSLNGIE